MSTFYDGGMFFQQAMLLLDTIQSVGYKADHNLEPGYLKEYVIP